MPACNPDCATFTLTATAVPSEVAPLRRAVVAYARDAGLARPALDDLALAVSELLTNVVLHAYPDGLGRGAMSVTARFDGDGLLVTVTDEGIGIAPTRPPRFGLGLTIAREVSDRLELATADGGGAAVRLSFPARG